MTSLPVNICNEKDTRLEKGKLNTKYKFTLLPAQKRYIANRKIFINSTNPSNYRLEDLRITFKSCREDLFPPHNLCTLNWHESTLTDQMIYGEP